MDVGLARPTLFPSRRSTCDTNQDVDGCSLRDGSALGIGSLDDAAIRLYWYGKSRHRKHVFRAIVVSNKPPHSWRIVGYLNAS
jgi:hypothetical protein